MAIGNDLTFTDNGKIKHTIMLNPGHGINGLGDTGLIANGLRECDIAREIAEAAARLLHKEGHEVRLIQSANVLGDDEELQSLECVVTEALALRPDVFLTIHTGEGRTRKRGYSCVVRYPRSLSWAVATQVQSAVWDATVDYDPQFWDRGVLTETSTSILNHLTAIPAAVLFCAGYLDNEKDAQMLKAHASEIGQAVGNGILSYFDFVDSELEFQYNLKRQYAR